METLVTMFHAFVAVLLILAVLLQSSKGGGLASSIGGGMGAGSVLGGRTAASFMVKLTSVLGGILLFSCLLQGLVFRANDEVPTTATQRILEEGGVPLQPVAESPGFLEQPTSEPTPDDASLPAK